MIDAIALVVLEIQSQCPCVSVFVIRLVWQLLCKVFECVASVGASIKRGPGIIIRLSFKKVERVGADQLPVPVSPFVTEKTTASSAVSATLVQVSPASSVLSRTMSL